MTNWIFENGSKITFNGSTMNDAYSSDEGAFARAIRDERERIIIDTRRREEQYYLTHRYMTGEQWIHWQEVELEAKKPKVPAYLMVDDDL